MSTSTGAIMILADLQLAALHQTLGAGLFVPASAAWPSTAAPAVPNLPEAEVPNRAQRRAAKFGRSRRR